MATTRRLGGLSSRCECRGPDGKRLGSKCPKASRRGHQRFAIGVTIPPDTDGKPRKFRRTGYEERTAAERDLTRLLAVLQLADDPDATDTPQLVGDYLAHLMTTRAPLPDDVTEVTKAILRGRLPALTSGTKTTVANLLDDWLAAKARTRRATTLNGYKGHVRKHLKPALGTVLTSRLTVAHVQLLFDDIADQADVIRAENAARAEQVLRTRWTKPGRPPAAERERLAAERERLAQMPPFRKITGPNTCHAIRRSLRGALNWGLARPAEYGLEHNVAKHVELAAFQRPKGMLWTAERVATWRVTGERPGPVMVWTPAQLGAFLDVAESISRLYAALHVITYLGLRRGEAVGLAWDDVDFETMTVYIRQEITVDVWKPIETDPKTDGSASAVRMDPGTARVLLAHRRRQEAERAARQAAGKTWVETGKVFTQEDGSWLHPEMLSDEFRRITGVADLPPINLRDTRHVAAGLVKAAGGDIYDVKTRLRHDTIKLASDTYLELFEELTEELAVKIADVVPRARKAPDPGGEVESRAG